MRKIVIADAGPLIAFARVQQLGLLPQMFERVLVTDEVIAECTVRPDFAESQAILVTKIMAGKAFVKEIIGI